MKMTPQQRFKMRLEITDEGIGLIRSGIMAEKGFLMEEELRGEVIRSLRKYAQSLLWLDDMGIGGLHK